VGIFSKWKALESSVTEMQAKMVDGLGKSVKRVREFEILLKQEQDKVKALQTELNQYKNP